VKAAIDRAARDARRRLARHRRFQAGLWSLFAHRSSTAAPYATAETIICRCEEISLGQIEAEIGGDRPAIGEVKRRTRVGMGRCQGRYCSHLLATILSERHGRPLDEFAYFAPRAPIKPVLIDDLLRREGP
jgi:NAD(P)H-nitrite reductase large subunit